MTPVILTLPNRLFRLQSLLWPSPASALKAFSTFITIDGEETPAMNSLKDIPYPSTSPDLSIFESRSDEYDGVRLPPAFSKRQSLAKLSSSNRPHNVSGLLEQLSLRGKFTAAEEVRRELVGMKVLIRPSLAYYRTARYILRRRPWPPNRAEMFANWLSLLPNTAETKRASYYLTKLRMTLFFNSSQLDLESVTHFGVILSSKGYIRSVGAFVVAFLTRYAHPDVSLRILDKMMAADGDYRRLTNDAETPKKTSKRLWSILVRTHCTTGRPEVALQMAKRAHERGFHLTQYTYQYLLGKLEADGLKESAAEVRTLSGCRSLDVAKSRFIDKNLTPKKPIPAISRKQSAFVNRDLVMAILKRSSRSGLPACASSIMPYFNIYKRGLRGNIIVNKLRSRAYRLSPHAASTVLLAELLHHYCRGQFIHVIWVFEKFYHVVGVPAEDVKQRLWKRDHYPPRLRLHYWTLPPRITETTLNLPSKLWPTTYHTALVWSALVQLCESEEELFALYDQLLAYSAQFQRSVEARMEPNRHGHEPGHELHGGGDSSTPVVVPAERYDAAHFRPFLIAFTFLRSANQALRVLDDMQDRGVALSAPFLGTGAALQARHGEPEAALRMLDVMREVLLLHPHPHSSPSLHHHHHHHSDTDSELRSELARGGGGSGSEAGKRRALLTAHTAVLRGLLDRRAIEQAQRVAELLRDRLGYVEGSGSNVYTDTALRFLRRLEADGPSAEPDPLPMERELDEHGGHHQLPLYPFIKKRDDEVSSLSPPARAVWARLFHLFSYTYDFYDRSSKR